MTVFDRLEAQLLAAHPQHARRHVPRPAPRRIVAFAAAAAAVAVIAAAALSAGSSSTSTPAAQPGDAVAPVVPGKTTVAILNSTRTPGLAGQVATALAKRGWKIGSVTNGPDQSKKSSCIEFTRGHAAAASQIADQLGIETVRPADTVTPVVDIYQRLAGPAVDVIVVVGADRAR